MIQPTYNSFITIAIVLSIALISIRYRLRYVDAFSHITDVCIAGLVGGVIGARLFHVLIHWQYFQSAQAEIWRLSAGGLNWHGVLLGSLLLMAVMTHYLKLNWAFLLDLLVMPLLIMAFFSWWACDVAQCSYGAEVDNLSDYPALLVHEAPGEFNIVAPRYATQPLGMFGVAVIAFIILYSKVRFWFTLLILSSWMLIVDALRGDPVPEFFDIRVDMWLDMIFIIVNIVALAKLQRIGSILRTRSSHD